MFEIYTGPYVIKHKHKKYFRSNLLLLYIVTLLMAISHDIELNPGPVNHNNSTIYPCGTCNQPVTWDHRAVVCDTCDQWYHTDCQDVHTSTNYSTICFDIHSICSENPYSILSISNSSLPSPGSGQHLRPQHASTPERKTDRIKKKAPNQTPLKILNINCKSIKKKQDRIENIQECTKPYIVIATETWLDPSITDNQIFSSN